MKQKHLLGMAVAAAFCTPAVGHARQDGDGISTGGGHVGQRIYIPNGDGISTGGGHIDKDLTGIQFGN